MYVDFRRDTQRDVDRQTEKSGEEGGRMRQSSLNINSLPNDKKIPNFDNERE